MSGCYAYFTGDDGHITNRVTILAADDEDAKERANNWLTARASSYGRKARSRHSIHRKAAARWPAVAGGTAAHCPRGQWLATHAVI
jgi:hypothetical protein